MSNISLGGNHGNSINFDGAMLQNQQEAEYRKEEEQQQNELRALLTNAFDDLIDEDDILSITSEEGTDSRNVSLVRRHSNDSLGRPPTEERIEEERPNEGWTDDKHQNSAGDPSLESVPSKYPHHLARRYGNFEPLSRTQELQRGNIEALRTSVESLPNFPSTSQSRSDRSSSVRDIEHLDSDYQSSAGDNDRKSADFHGVVYTQQQHQGHIQGQGHNIQQYASSDQVHHIERENILRRSIEDFHQLREAYRGQGHGDQFYGDQAHHQQHQQHHYQQPAEQPYDQSQVHVGQGQGHFYQGHDAGGHHHGYHDHHHHFKNIYENRPYHTIGEREETEGGNVQPVPDNHYYTQHAPHGYGYHDNMGYYRHDYIPQGQEVTAQGHVNYNEIPQTHVMGNQMYPGVPTQPVPEAKEPQISQPVASTGSRRLPNLQRHFSNDSDKKHQNNESQSASTKGDSGRGQKGDYPEGHKVTYKRDNSDRQKSKKDRQEKIDSEDSREERAFIEQGGSMDQQQLAQLQILYKARGKKIEELTNEVEVMKGESARELRILKHQLSVAKAEREGSSKSLDSVQDLLQEVKGENSQLIGKLRAAETQVDGLKKGKDELVKKLQTAETTIESLHQHLEELGSSDSLTRARHDHETVVNGLQKKYETEIKHLQEKITELSDSLKEKDDQINLLGLKLTESVKASEQAQISRAETINRLTQSLEESQKRCRNLLESTASQDLSQMKIQLQQALASRAIADEMCSSLQDEIGDLKEQVQMLESASSLGVSTQQNTNSFADQNDSMADLGIKKTLDFDTPQNTPVIVKSQSKVSNDMVSSLKSELERCLISNKQKRSEVSQLKEEMKTMKKDLIEYKQRLERADLMTQEQKRRITELEGSMHSPDKANAVENRLKKDVENLKREKKILSEDIDELQRRLEEISKSEEKLTELNHELSKQIADMVKEYDQDKRQALERVQRACEQVSETSRGQLRQELTIQFDGERSAIISKYETELNNLREELKSAQDEVDRVKELYVCVCEEKDQLKEKMDSDWTEKLEQDILKVKEEMKKESELSMLRAEEGWDRKKEEMNKTFESEKSKIVEMLKTQKEEELKSAKDKFEEEIKTMKDIMEIERSNDLEKIDKQKLNEIEKLRNLINDKEAVIGELEKEKNEIMKSKQELEQSISDIKSKCDELNQIQKSKEEELSGIKAEYNQNIELLKLEIGEKIKEIENLNSDIEVLKQNIETSKAEVMKEKSDELNKARKEFEKLLKEKENELDKLKKEGNEKDEVESLRKEIDKKGRQNEVEALKKEIICFKLEIERMEGDKQIEIDKVCRIKQSEIDNLEKRKQNEIERLKKEKSIEIERLVKEKEDEISKLKEKSGKQSETEGDVTTKFKDRLNKEMEESIQKAVDAKVAMSKVVWLEEHRATRQTAIDNAVRLAETEIRLKMEGELEDKLQKRLDEAKVLWQNDSSHQLEEERRKSQDGQEQELSRRVEEELEKWKQSELKREIAEEEEKWLKDFELRLEEERQKWTQEFETRLDEEKQSWIEFELETQRLKWSMDWEQKILEEKENWQRNILEPAKKKWKHDTEEKLRMEKENWRCMELETEKLNLMREFEDRLKSEKQAWMSKDLPSALEKEKKSLIKELEDRMKKEKQSSVSEEIVREVEKERQKWTNIIEERVKEEKNDWKNTELPQEIEKERRKWMKLMEVTLAKERDNWKTKELPDELNKAKQEIQTSLEKQSSQQVEEKLTAEKAKLQKESEAKVLEAIEEHEIACKEELEQTIAREKDRLKQKFEADLQDRYLSEKKVWKEMLDQELNQKVEVEREKWRRKSESDFNKKLDSEKDKLRAWLRAEFEKKMEAEQSQMRGELEAERTKMKVEFEADRSKFEAEKTKIKAEHESDRSKFEAERLKLEEDRKKIREHERKLGTESDSFKEDLEKEFDQRLRSELESMREKFEMKAEEEYNEMKRKLENTAKEDFEQYKLSLENEMQVNLDSERELIGLKADREIARKIEDEETNWKNQFEKELTQKLQKEEEKWKDMIEKDIEARLAGEKQKWEEEKQEELKELIESEQEKFEEVKQKEMKIMSDELSEKFQANLEEEIEKYKIEMEMDYHHRMEQEVQCAIDDCRREYTMEMSINTTSAEASQGLLREELEAMKQRTESLQSELIKKEADWLKEKEDILLQKDLERRKEVDGIQEKAELEYKQFLSEHQDTLDKALKQAREQHNKDKTDLENRYTTQIKLLQATIQSLRNQLQESMSGTQEHADLLAEVEKERVIWYEERDNLIQEISERDSLLGKADVHLSKEVDKLRSELQAAYQRRLESETASYKQKLESDFARANNSEQKEKLQLEKQLSEVNTELKKLKTQNGEINVELKKLRNLNNEDKTKHAEEMKKLSDIVNECKKKVEEYDRMEGELKKAKEILKGYKEEISHYEENEQKYKKEYEDLQNKLTKGVQNQERLQAELQKLKEEKLTVIESVKSIENTYKQKHEEASAKIAKTDKLLQDMKQKYRAELESLRKALEAENDVAMNAMKNKMIELQKTHVNLLDEMRKKHLKEKEALLKQGQITAARGVTPVANSTDVEQDINQTVKELRSQYLDTVAKIKDDVLRHITETNVRAAETVKFEMDKERFSTFHQIKEFYKQNVKQILETELIGSTLESKLLAVEEALENLSSTPSSRSTTPKSDDFILDEKQRSRSTSRDTRDAGISPKGQRSVSFVTSTRGDRSRTPVSNTTKDMSWVGDKSFEDPRSPKGSRYEEGQGDSHRSRDRTRDGNDLRHSYDWSQESSSKFDTRRSENRPVSAKIYREYKHSEHSTEERPLSAKSPRELHITLRERNNQDSQNHRDRERNKSGEKRKQRTLISTRDIHSGRYTRSGDPQGEGHTSSSRSKSVTPMYSGIAASSPSLYRPTSVPDLSVEDKELKIWTETNNDTYRYTPLRDTLRSGTNLHRSNSKSESDLSLAEKNFGPLKADYDSNLDLSTGSLTSDSFMSPRKRDAGETPTSTPRRSRKHFTLHSFPTQQQINNELRNQSAFTNDNSVVNSPASVHSVPRERKNLPLIQFRHGKMTSLSRVGVTSSKSPHPEESVIRHDTPPTRDNQDASDRHYRPLSVSSNLHLNF